MKNDTILVMGATGAVGAEVLRLAVEAGRSVVGASRRPDAAAARVGGRWVELDLERPETFAPALSEVSKVFLIARPGDEEADRFAAPLIEAMVDAKVRHVVHLSAMGAEARPSFSIRKVELLLEASGLSFTHLRPNWFFQVLGTGALQRGILAAGEIRLPAGDAGISYLDARDVARAAASVLTTPGHEGEAYTLTGPEALDHAQIAHTIERVRGAPVRYLAIDEAEARATLSASGFPSPWIERLIAFYRLVRDGACAPVTEDLARLLARRPTTFAAFAEEHATAWAPPTP